MMEKEVIEESKKTEEKKRRASIFQRLPPKTQKRIRAIKRKEELEYQRRMQFRMEQLKRRQITNGR